VRIGCWNISGAFRLERVVIFLVDAGPGAVPLVRNEERHVGIDDLWAEFTESVRSIASRTIGTKPAGKDKRKVMAGLNRAGDQLLKIWLRRWRKTQREKRVIDDSDLPRWRALDAEQREIGVHIKHHVRRRVREQQNRELDKVRALKPKQMREHWRKLKAVGNIKISSRVYTRCHPSQWTARESSMSTRLACAECGTIPGQNSRNITPPIAGSTRSSMSKSKER
jgi:hypothetical protein